MSVIDLQESVLCDLCSNVGKGVKLPGRVLCLDCASADPELVKEIGYESEDDLLKSEVGLSREQLVARIAAETEPIAKPGEIGRGRNRVDNINSKAAGGTSAKYLTSVIARDRPDIHERMKKGEFKCDLCSNAGKGTVA